MWLASPPRLNGRFATLSGERATALTVAVCHGEQFQTFLLASGSYILDIDVYKEWLGIPEGPRPPNHYILLRLVPFEDATDKIRANYKKLNSHVRKYATGQYSERSQDLLNEMAKAMLCLTDAERKKEYDRGLGREFDEDESARKPLEAILVEQGVITSEQAEEAKAYADRAGFGMRDAIVQMKLTDATIATQAYAQEQGLSFVDLSDVLPEDNVLDVLPKNVVKQHSILPLFIDTDVVLVAASEPIEPDIEQDLRLRYDVPVRTVLAVPSALNQAIAKYYAPGVRSEQPAASPAAKSKKEAPAKKDAKAAKGAAAAAPAEKKKVEKSHLTPAEIEAKRKQNQLVAVIAICWSVVIGFFLWQFFGDNVLFGWKSAVFFLGLPAVTAGVVWATLLQK